MALPLWLPGKTSEPPLSVRICCRLAPSLSIALYTEEEMAGGSLSAGVSLTALGGAANGGDRLLTRQDTVLMPGQERLLSPYPLLSLLDQKRLRCTQLLTTYAYDYIHMFELAVQHEWDRAPDACGTRPAKLLTAIELQLAKDGTSIVEVEPSKPATNKVGMKEQILGISHNGQAKAFPVNMLYYHHQIADEVGGHPIWPTYCGLCNSGRIYDRQVDGSALEFTLVGAVNYNATFRDHTTGSWWRQEVGDAIKGPMKGRALEDMPFEQMSLESWLSKHPESLVLQYDPTFQKQYNIRTALLNYEVSLPGWHMQASPPLVVGVVAGNVARAYDWNELVKRRLVEDEAGGTALLAVTDPDGDSAFVYDRTVDGTVLSFEMAGDGMRDTGTGSSWDCFGRCTKGKLKGKSLTRLQSYKQYVRAWVTFHPDASFFDFQNAG